MDINQLVTNMTEDMFLRLKHVAETGKWPEGNSADQQQKDSALQLVIAYQAMHMNNTELLTVGSDGQLIHKSKQELKANFKKPTPDKKCDKSDIARFSEL